jgi:hypothetical protein
MKRWGEEEWILAVTIAMLVAFLVFMLSLSGCASKQSKYSVRYTKGCAIDVAVMTADSAARILKSMEVTDCVLTNEVEDTK